MVLLDAADAVGHDFVDRLDDAVGRQAAVLDAQIHAAAAGIEADAQLIRGGKLRAEQVAAPGGKDIVVVKAGGAAVLHQLAEPRQAREPDDVGIQIFPDLIERFQPVEQLHILHLRQVAGKDLIQVVVRVDKAGVAQHVRPVDHLVGADIEMRADLTDEAALTEEVDALEDAVPVVAGDELGDASDKQGRQRKNSFPEKNSPRFRGLSAV